MLHENEISGLIVDTCFKIHVAYGPGLFESVYEEIFCFEWEKKRIPFVRQKGVKVIHEGIDMGIGFVPDIVIDNKIILELKSLEKLAEVHFKQLLTYLRIIDIKLGLLINFNVPYLRNGIHPIANNI